MAGLVAKTLSRFLLKLPSLRYLRFGGLAEETLAFRYRGFTLCAANFDQIALAQIRHLSVITAAQEWARVGADAEAQRARSCTGHADEGEVVGAAKIGSIRRLHLVHSRQEGNPLDIAAARVDEETATTVMNSLNLVLLAVAFDLNNGIRLRQDKFLRWMEGIREIPRHFGGGTDIGEKDVSRRRTGWSNNLSQLKQPFKPSRYRVLFDCEGHEHSLTRFQLLLPQCCRDPIRPIRDRGMHTARIATPAAAPFSPEWELPPVRGQKSTSPGARLSVRLRLRRLAPFQRSRGGMLFAVIGSRGSEWARRKRTDHYPNQSRSHVPVGMDAQLRSAIRHLSFSWRGLVSGDSSRVSTATMLLPIRHRIVALVSLHIEVPPGRSHGARQRLNGTWRQRRTWHKNQPGPAIRVSLLREAWSLAGVSAPSLPRW